MHWTPWAFCLAAVNEGKSKEASIAMIAMTTSNSISVKARLRRQFPRDADLVKRRSFRAKRAKALSLNGTETAIGYCSLFTATFQTPVAAGLSRPDRITRFLRPAPQSDPAISPSIFVLVEEARKVFLKNLRKSNLPKPKARRPNQIQKQTVKYPAGTGPNLS
jgi:hypothetical protein